MDPKIIVSPATASCDCSSSIVARRRYAHHCIRDLPPPDPVSSEITLQAAIFRLKPDLMLSAKHEACVSYGQHVQIMRLPIIQRGHSTLPGRVTNTRKAAMP
jgi:hypothetical protein